MNAPREKTLTHLPDPHQPNGWYEQLALKAAARRVVGTIDADWAVVGGGICGLSAARRLAELRPEDSILVIEAARIGYATSGRNAGFMLSHHSHGGITHIENARLIDRLCSAGYRELRRLVEEFQIRCDWHECGQIYVSVGATGEGDLSSVAKGFDALGVGYEWLDRDPLSTLTGTRHYRQGLKVGDSALVQPAAMMRGLGETLPVNVQVFEDSAVSKIVTDNGLRLICPEGEVLAANLVLTSHLFNEDFGFARRLAVPIATFASLTRVLRPEERASLGDPGQFGLLPANRNGSTVRFTADGRIFMRNTLRYARDQRFTSTLLEAVAGNHAASIDTRWPSLRGIELAATWGGVLAFTRNEGAVFGQFDKRIYGAITTDAAPMTRGVMMGKLLAEKICGRDSKALRCLEALPAAARLPPEMLLRFFTRRAIRQIETAGSFER